MSHQTREAGNVLFLILIAVVLFAALSYAVSQNTRGGGIDPSEEKAELVVAEIMNYITALQTTITRLQISNGCEDTEISFENSFVNGYENPNAPPDKSCHVFDPDGGGLLPMFNSKVSVTQGNYFEGSVAITGIGKTCTSSECSDLYFLRRLSNTYSIGAAEKICEVFNKRVGIRSDIQNIGDSTQNRFAGTYGYSKTIAKYPGKMTFCAREGGSIITVISVLIAR